MRRCELELRCGRVTPGSLSPACPRLALEHGTRGRSRLLRPRLIVSALALAGATFGQTPATAPAGATCESGAGTGLAQAPDVNVLAEQLGNDDYRVREDATRQLLLLGPDVIPALEARLEDEADPEARFRLRFVLENVRPPQNAVLVIRPDYGGSGLWAGDVITHVNNVRVRSRAELLRRLGSLHTGAMLRVRRAAGPFETLLKAGGGLPVLCDYRAPEGEVIASALRLYDDGYAERAYDLLCDLEPRAPESELPALLYAIMAYTAGDAKTAYQIMAEHPDACKPVSVANSWTSMSALDLAGPKLAPYHVEWKLWTEAALSDARFDRDVPMQRVLIPAGRFTDALIGEAGTWWKANRPELGQHPDNDQVGGNRLAVTAWMLSELDLVSEAMRLVEPRSIILRRSPQGVRKWVRVRTDAWLPFAAGDARAALDGFYEDARAILQPPGPPADRVVQNPQIAAQVAFFLYQFPTDERVSEMLTVVNQPDYAPLSSYAHWMLYALRAENLDLERQHMLAMLPNARDSQAGEFALAAALLEYVRQRPDPEVIAAARTRLADAPDSSDKHTLAALIEALEHLAAGKAEAAGKALSMAGDQPGVPVLRSTAEFLAAITATPPLDVRLQQPILAARLGADGGKWLVLTRARQFVRCDLATGDSAPISISNPNWFPGPLNWPWVGREESSGRVCIYGLRRVTELTGSGDSGVRLNIRTEDIPAFDRYLRRDFSALAELVAEARLQGDETGELWREDLQSGQEYFADPDLPEIGFIRALPPERRIVQVAFRGGATLLIDVTGGRSWSSQRIADELGLKTPPRFLAQTVGASTEDSADAEHGRSDGPVLYLFSDAGLLRLDSSKGQVRRIDLPGPEPHPVLIPESCPYERRDPCWVYCARLPEAGGQVYRLSVSDDHVEMLDMVNEAVPREYYLMQTRAELRRKADELLARAGMPGLREFVRDTEQLLAKYAEVDRP
jgi:hypothetical protein